MVGLDVGSIPTMLVRYMLQSNWHLVGMACLRCGNKVLLGSSCGVSEGCRLANMLRDDLVDVTDAVFLCLRSKTVDLTGFFQEKYSLRIGKCRSS